jgi:hypothetical protein
LQCGKINGPAERTPGKRGEIVLIAYKFNNQGALFPGCGKNTKSLYFTLKTEYVLYLGHASGQKEGKIHSQTLFVITKGIFPGLRDQGNPGSGRAKGIRGYIKGPIGPPERIFGSGGTDEHKEGEQFRDGGYDLGIGRKGAKAEEYRTQPPGSG